MRVPEKKKKSNVTIRASFLLPAISELGQNGVKNSPLKVRGRVHISIVWGWGKGDGRGTM